MTAKQNCDTFRQLKMVPDVKRYCHNQVDEASSKNSRLAFLERLTLWPGAGLELGILLLQPPEYWSAGLCLNT